MERSAFIMEKLMFRDGPAPKKKEKSAVSIEERPTEKSARFKPATYGGLCNADLKIQRNRTTMLSKGLIHPDLALLIRLCSLLQCVS